MLGSLAQRLHVVARLLAVGQWNLVDGHVGGHAADVDVLVVDEVWLGAESRLATVGNGFLEHLAVEWVAELQAVGSHVVVEELGDGQVVKVALVVLHILQDHRLAVSHHELHDHLLDGRGSLCPARRLHGCRLADGCWLRLRLCTLLLLAAASPVANELVHLVDERSLGNAHALRAVVQIGIAQDGVHYHRDTLHDTVDGLAALQRVAFVLQQQVGLELYEVALMFLQILAEVAGRMLAGKRVRVVAVGQQQHLQVHALAEQHVRAAQGSVDAGSVAVVKQYDVRREAVQDVYLVCGERCARVGHHVLDACLMHGDDVGVALHHVHAVLLGDGALGLIETVQLAVLVVYLRVGRVHVLLLHALRGSIQLAATEAHHLAAYAYPWEDDATGIAVDELAAVVLVADAHLLDVLLLVTLLQRRAGKGVAVVQVEAQLELLDDVVAYAALAKVLHADGHAVGVLVQRVLEVLHCIFVHDEHRFPLALLALLLVAQFALLNLDMVFVGQPAQRLGIGHLLVFHDEVHGRATLATAEAVAGVAGR